MSEVLAWLTGASFGAFATAFGFSVAAVRRSSTEKPK